MHKALLHRGPQSTQNDNMMRCSHRVARHFDFVSCSGIRAACTSVGAETSASLCMPNVMGAGNTVIGSYCLASTPGSTDVSKSVCTSDRSCGCSQCSAETSSSSHNSTSNSARLPGNEMRLASGFLRHKEMSQRLQGLVAGIPYRPFRSYSSFSSTRQDSKTHARSFATLEDSQSKVSNHKHSASPSSSAITNIY